MFEYVREYVRVCVRVWVRVRRWVVLITRIRLAGMV